MGHSMSKCLQWVHKDPTGKAAKHFGWKHPLFAAIASSGWVVVVALLATRQGSAAHGPLDEESTRNWSKYGIGLLAYLAVLILTRVKEGGPRNLYEMLWGCNLAILLAGIGLIGRMPKLIEAAATSISIDQFMWYADVAGYFLSGRKSWPIGVAKYLEWPDTPFIKKITGTHHLWFLPLVLYLLRRVSSFDSQVHIASILICVAESFASRLFTPLKFRLPSGKEEYMNINCAYECWQDVKFPFLHWTDGAAAHLHLPDLAFWWNTCNLPFYILLKLLAAGIRG